MNTSNMNYIVYLKNNYTSLHKEGCHQLGKHRNGELTKGSNNQQDYKKFTNIDNAKKFISDLGYKENKICSFCFK